MRVTSWSSTASSAKGRPQMYEQRLAENLGPLAASLRNGSYRPQAVRRVWIAKPGSREQRPLGIPTVPDRVAQAALLNVIEPIFERDCAEHRYGFRPARGGKDALRRVEELLKAGFTWVVDADLKSDFDTIRHGPLLERVAEKIADGRVRDLIKAFLNQGVMSEGKELASEAGTPQGGVISPLLANIYLDPLDRLVAQAGCQMVRDADDFVIVCRSEAEARRALEQVRQWTAPAGLVLHPEKTRIVDWTASDGFDFLGYHFGPDRKWPGRKSLKKFKDAIRAQTGRHNGQSLPAIIADLNRMLPGWFESFKPAHHDIFKSLDSWIRMRLRSILRRRQGRRGRRRGTDQVRWPNADFEARGLFSLASAHAHACQSSRR